MFNDPIIQEIRDIRKEIEREHPDGESFYRHYERLQKDSGKALIRRPPKRISRSQAS